MKVSELIEMLNQSEPGATVQMLSTKWDTAGEKRLLVIVTGVDGAKTYKMPTEAIITI